MATKTKESAKLRKLWAAHVNLIIAGDESRSPDARREYYAEAQIAYRVYEKAGGKR